MLRLTILAIAVAIVVLCTSAMVSAARPKWHQLTPDYSYAQYLSDFGKQTPTDPTEYAMRESIFKASLRSVLVHNSDHTKLYRKGINHLSDWTARELKSLRGGRAVQMAGVAEQLKNKPSYLGLHKVTSNVPIPASFDVRGRVPNIVSAIKDQGRCGSCWSFASTEAIESYAAALTGELFVLSTEQLVACAPNPNECGGTGGCGGSIFQLAADYLISFGGQTEEWSYGYSSFMGTTGTCRKDNIGDLKVMLSGYKMIESNNQDAFMNALVVNNAPLVVNVDASEWQNYESGIFSGCDYSKNISIDHAVNVVGYGTHHSADGKTATKYWIVRNSWSADWGELGYIRLIRHDTPECGWNVDNQDGVGCKGQPSVVRTCGQCGILYSTGYPVIAGTR